MQPGKTEIETVVEEPPELVAMRLALGKQLAARRKAAGIIQPQIARRTGYSRSSVAHAEGELLATYDQVRAAMQAHEAQSREAELARAYAEARARAQELRADTSSSLFQSGHGLADRTGGARESGRRCRCGTGQWPGRAAPVPGASGYANTGRAYGVERSAW